MANVQTKPTPLTQATQTAAQNTSAAQGILLNAIRKEVDVPFGAVDPNAVTNQSLAIPIRNTGLIRKLRIEVSGIIHNNSTTTALTRTQWGIANFLSNLTYVDFSNNQRHNTTGRHVNLMNSIKDPTVFGAAYAPNLPINYGNNFAIFQGPSSIAASSDGAVRMVYDLDLAYSDTNLKGAVYAALTNQVSYLQLTINPNPAIADGDAVNAMYASGASGQSGQWKAGSQVTFKITQFFWDQLPTDGGNNSVGQALPILPLQDLSWAYEWKETVLTGITANADFPYQYSSGYQFLSTGIIYDNAGQLNAGTDINYFQLLTANAAQIWKRTPLQAALLAREQLMSDLPLGSYLFDSRAQPINVQTWGNVQLNINAISAATGATVIVDVEDFRQYTSNIQSGSLAAG
jgi:hypothetical protein